MHSDVAILSKPCIWHEASRIVNEEGFRAFWKGNLVTIAHRLPYSAVSFYAFERYKNVISFFYFVFIIFMYFKNFCILSCMKLSSLCCVPAIAFTSG